MHKSSHHIEFHFFFRKWKKVKNKNHLNKDTNYMNILQQDFAAYFLHIMLTVDILVYYVFS